jgi:hypothetical protein
MKSAVYIEKCAFSFMLLSWLFFDFCTEEEREKKHEIDANVSRCGGVCRELSNGKRKQKGKYCLHVRHIGRSFLARESLNCGGVRS